MSNVLLATILTAWLLVMAFGLYLVTSFNRTDEKIGWGIVAICLWLAIYANLIGFIKF